MVLLRVTAIVVTLCACHVLAEICTVDNDCTETQCAGGNHVICQHPDGAGVVADGGLCTCAAPSVECTSQEDCFGDGSSLICPDSIRHCYDNRCICDRFPVSGR